jgi:hypothetical protein
VTTPVVGEGRMSLLTRNWRVLACLAIATLLIGAALGLFLRAEESLAEVVLIRDGSSVPNPFIREKFTAL